MRRLAFVVALVALCACEGDEPAPVVENPPVTAPGGYVTEKIIDGLGTVCWNGYRIFLDNSGSQAYSGRNIAVIAEAGCK